jgi:hypothetical protein
MYLSDMPYCVDISSRLRLTFYMKKHFKSNAYKIDVKSLSDEGSWDYKNGFYWFSHLMRMGKPWLRMKFIS